MRIFGIILCLLAFAGFTTVNAQEAAGDAAPAAKPATETPKEAATPAKPTAKETAAPTGDDLKSRIMAEMEKQTEWKLFRKGKGVSRMKMFGAQNFYGPKDNDLFKVATVDDKHYAMLKNGTILEEHWENKAKFTDNFIPYAKFIEETDKQIELLDKDVQKLTSKKEKVDDDIDKLKARMRVVTTDINDSRVNQVVKSQSETILRNLKRELDKVQKECNSLRGALKKQTHALDELKKLRKKYPDDIEDLKQNGK